jgi:transposase
MLKLDSVGKVHLAPGATDLRKSVDGLAAIVSVQFELDPFSDQWFVFCNRRHNKLKILRWEHNGFWLHYRRLERGHFQWPDHSGKTMLIDRRQLQWLLDGLNLEQKQAHKAVKASAVI